jgi:hypothetical protein
MDTGFQHFTHGDGHNELQKVRSKIQSAIAMRPSRKMAWRFTMFLAAHALRANTRQTPLSNWFAICSAKQP